MGTKIKPKICFVAGTLGRGGAERQLFYMLRELKRSGANVRLISLTKGESFEREIKDLGVSVDYVGGSNFKLIRLWRIIRSLKKEPADIVQSAHFYTNLYVAVAAFFTGARGIGAIRNDLTSEELKVNRAFGRGHLRLPEHMIANSSLARTRAIERGVNSNRIDLLNNAVDVEWLRSARNGHPHRAVHVLFVGRLVEQKRPDLFLRIIANVNKRVPKGTLKATMIGDGPMREGLESLALSLGLSTDTVQLTGKCDDMPRAYSSADILVSTSSWEGTPNVVLEALACGIAVVATRVGGVPELAGEDRALLVDAEDESRLTSALLRLIEDEDLRKRLGKSGAEYVERSHSLHALGNQLTDIYERVLANQATF